jgi:FtsP/CotA-like multicopper oxidase with cupredoxin domain
VCACRSKWTACRFFLLDMDGQLFTTIGTDGGLQERPTEAGTVLITAGERLDLLVRPSGKPGSTLVLRAMLYNRGYGSVEYRDVEELLTIEFSADGAGHRDRLTPSAPTTRS